MSRVPELDAHAVWRSAAAGCVLGMVVSCFNALLYSYLRGPQILVARLLWFGWSLLSLAYLLMQWRRPNIRSCLMVYLLLAMPLLYGLWSLDTAMAATARGLEPFLRHRLAFMIFAMLSPGEFIYTATIILALVGEAGLEYWLGGIRYSPNIHAGEPWITAMYATAVLVLVYYRARHAAQERTWRLEQQECLTMERLARMALAVRDLMNTPLQTLQLGTAMFRRGNMEPAVLAAMQRAVERVAELNQVLRDYETDFNWHPGDESFDPVAVLRRDGQCSGAAQR